MYIFIYVNIYLVDWDPVHGVIPALESLQPPILKQKSSCKKENIHLYIFK